MANDFEADIKVGVSAEADISSAEKAGKDLEKGVLSSLKDGYIPVPVELKMPIKGASKELLEAQEKVIAQWDKTYSKGFSSSKKDLNELTDAYMKFKKLASSERKTTSAPVKKITALMGDQIQEYTNQRAAEKAARVAKTQKELSRRKQSRMSTITDEEISANIRDRRKRQLSGVKTIAKGLDYKTKRNIDPGRTSDVAMRLSENGPYGTNWNIQQINAAREAAKDLKHTKKRYTDKAFAESRNVPEKSKTTDKQLSKIVADQSIKGLIGMVKDSEKGTLVDGIDAFRDQLKVVSESFAKNGKDMQETYQAIGSALEAIYSDSSKRQLGGTSGDEKGVGINHEATQEIMKTIYAELREIWDATDPAVRQMKQFYRDTELARKSVKNFGKELSKSTATRKTTTYNESKNETLNKNKDADLKQVMQTAFGALTKSVDNLSGENDLLYNQTVRESTREGIADSAEAQKNRTIIEKLDTDLGTGFNTDENAREAISAIEAQGTDVKDSFKKIKDTLSDFDKTTLAGGECPCQTILEQISADVQMIRNGLVGNTSTITKSRKIGYKDPEPTQGDGDRSLPAIVEKSLKPVQNAMVVVQNALVPVSKVMTSFKYDIPRGASPNGEYVRLLRAQREREASQQPQMGPLSRSVVETSVVNPISMWTKLKDAFAKLTNTTANYEKIMAKTSEEQDKMAAERIREYGFGRGRSAADTGDKSMFARRLSLFRGKDKASEIFKNLKITEGVKIDTTEVTQALAKVLSGKEMFTAQTGGIWRNIIGSMTLYAGMPSIEKSRSQADAVNQIMANIRKAMNDVLNDIQRKESALEGMRQSGDLKIGADGKILESSTTEAKVLVAQLEEQKLILASILADAGMVDEVVERTHGKIRKIVKQLGFTSPVLRENNAILANINAGLDKNGKALKFQTRLGEVLNYALQRMARSVGQMVKNWLMMLNPISLIKSAFKDFMSYNTKWQRTMNVVKYNLRRILEPFMEWLAQQLVNILGIVNAIIKGIGQAFGKDWDLFDKSAANAEKMKEDLEAAKNVTLDFDELHDIGVDSGDASMDLSGDIYTPQWGDLYDTITEKAKALTEFLIPIFKKLGDILKWCLDHWKLLVAAWAAFKIAKGLLKLLDWVKGLKTAFEALNLVSLGKLLGWLSIILGTILLIKSAFDRKEWYENFFGVNPDERREKGDKITRQAEIGGALIGGAALGMYAGPAGMIIGAELGDGIVESISGAVETALNLNKGDSAGVLHSAEKMGEGIGKVVGTMAGWKAGVALGGTIGSVFGPVGTMVGMALGATIGYVAGGAIGKGLGHVFGEVANGVQSLIRGSGAFQKLKVSADDVQDALQNVADKTTAYNTELTKLQVLEKQYGINAKELYNSVQNGSVAYENLSIKQKAVYDQYAKMLTAEQELNTAKIQSLEVSAKWEEQLAKESGDYSEYIKVLQKGMEDGTISQEKMVDYFAQTYGKLNADAKQVFIEQLPEYLRESVIEQGAQYETFGNKVATTWKNIKENVKEGITTMGENIRTGFENMVETITTGVVTAGQNVKTGFETMVENAKNNIETFKQDVSDGWNRVVENTKTNLETMKQNLSAAWDNMRTTASQKWEELKNSAIGQKVQEIWKNTTDKFNDLKTRLGQKWEEIKTGAYQGWQKIKDAIFGWVQKLWDAVTGVFNRIGDAARDTWQRVCNFFSGKGFKTNEQVDSSGNRKVSIQAYATGTNYVPSTGLAYLHQGEAVIPAKYNQPYTPQTGSSDEKISELTNVVRSLQQTVQQGIPIHGEFTQRGSDLVATVERASSRVSNSILNKKQYAR